MGNLCSGKNGVKEFAECAHRTLIISHTSRRWDRPFSAVSCADFHRCCYNGRDIQATQNATNTADSVNKTKQSSATQGRPLIPVVKPVDKKTSIFSQLSTQIKILEKNVSVAGLFLDKLGSRYKKLNTTVGVLRANMTSDLNQLRSDVNKTLADYSESNLLLVSGVLLELMNRTETIAQIVEELKLERPEGGSTAFRNIICKIEIVFFSFVGAAVAQFVFKGQGTPSVA